MKITIESTDQISAIDGVTVRAWEGVTDGGVKCAVFVHRIAVNVDQNYKQFERELIEEPAPQGTTLPIPVIADSIMWLAVVGNLQIALRHPANVGPSSRMVVDFAKALLGKLVEEGVLTDAEARVGFADFQ